jgi:hypothetical protein
MCDGHALRSNGCLHRLLPYLSLDLFNFSLATPHISLTTRATTHTTRRHCAEAHLPRLHLSYRHSTSPQTLVFHLLNNPRGLVARLESGCAHARHILHTAYCNVSSLCRLSLLRTIDTPIATFTMWSLSDFYLLCVLSCTSVVYPLCLGRRCSPSGSHSLATSLGWVEACFKAMVQVGSLQRMLQSIPLCVVAISLHVMLE